MPENILVVEYEPRYTDRVRQALAGHPFAPSFAKDGEEALRAIETPPQPRLIVLSSVVPKISATDLIRAIRNQKSTAETPILLTVSGYNGKSPKADAQRLGASDILPKPYSESEFLGKVRQMLGVGDGGGAKQFTSNELFGEMLEDDKAPTPGAKKTMKQTDDLDKMLADTLAGVMPQKKKTETNVPVPPPQQQNQGAQTQQIPKVTPPPAPAAPAPEPKPATKTASGNLALDKLMEDTLSGLDRTVRAPKPAPAPPPAAPKPAPAPAPALAAAPPAAEAKPKFSTDKIPVYTPEKVSQSSPIFPAPAPAPVHEEEEPKDGIKFGQYVLLEKIATGGMAEVWKARMRGVEGFQKIVAIKKILPHLSDNQDFIEMFIDEAKLAAQLNHNNIIHIYDLGKIQNSYYIAMEYVDGYDLKTILKRAAERDQPMQVELALFIASKIAAALDYAHRKRDFNEQDMGLVHRDVSPQNVLISEEGDIKLCDFGIAKAASKASHTQAGALKGKLQYMSPEQAWGRHIDKRSDVFALATVLFEMLTGRKLFAGDNELSILEQVREARVTDPSQFNDEVTPEIDAVVRKALQKDPGQRYQTAGEMARDLDQILYSFKPTPTSADLAIYMHRLASNEPVVTEPEPEPFVEAKPAAVAPAAAAAPAVAMPATFMPAAAPSVIEAAPGRKAPIVPILIGVAVVIAVVVGVLMMNKSKSNAPATTPVQTASVARGSAPAPVPVATTAATTSAATTIAPTATAPTATQASVDTAKVDEEVRKRLDAERAKLEQQRSAQTATTAPPVASRPAPQPVAAAPQPVASAPQPVAPAPQPVAPAPQPVVPAPQPAAAETPRVREGDLVAAGTEGLNPARITRQAVPVYPPLARQQRVEGSVIMNVLVSETGQVLDTRIISGVNRPVGINEAAQQTIRRSTFSPGTKDGVRVKSWTTVRVDFKL